MSEMLEKILSNENIERACKKVYANKGAGGVDGVTTKELAEYMQANWSNIKEKDSGLPRMEVGSDCGEKGLKEALALVFLPLWMSPPPGTSP